MQGPPVHHPYVGILLIQSYEQSMLLAGEREFRPCWSAQCVAEVSLLAHAFSNPAALACARCGQVRSLPDRDTSRPATSAGPCRRAPRTSPGQQDIHFTAHTQRRHGCHRQEATRGQTSAVPRGRVQLAAPNEGSWWSAGEALSGLGGLYGPRRRLGDHGAVATARAELGELVAVGIGLALGALGSRPQVVTVASGVGTEPRQHLLRIGAYPAGLPPGRRQQRPARGRRPGAPAGRPVLPGWPARGLGSGRPRRR